MASSVTTSIAAAGAPVPVVNTRIVETTASRDDDDVSSSSVSSNSSSITDEQQQQPTDKYDGKPLKKFKHQTKNAFKKAARKVRGGKKKETSTSAANSASSDNDSSAAAAADNVDDNINVDTNADTNVDNDSDNNINNNEDIDSTRLPDPSISESRDFKVVGSDFVGNKTEESTDFKSPFVEVLTADYSLLLQLSIFVALHVTLYHQYAAGRQQITLSVALSWMVVAFVFGRAVTEVPWFLLLQSQQQNDSTKGSDNDKDATTQRRRKSHRTFFSALNHAPLDFKRALFSDESTLMESSATTTKSSTKSTTEINNKNNSSVTKERNIVKEHHSNRVSFQEPPQDDNSEQKSTADANNSDSDGDSVMSPDTFGQFVNYENSLHDHVTTPILKYRGLDVFLSDDPENCVSDHPYFIKKGMRDVPTFVMNILTQWGNILIYFECPSWFESYKGLSVDDSDSMETKELKNFLMGDDNYRNKRYKMIPELHEAPSVVKMVMPNKQEYIVHNNWSPVTWRTFEREEGKKGRKLCPTIECELDCMKNSWTRGMCAVGKRQSKNVTLDIALLLGTVSAKGKTEKSVACLGLFRMRYIEVRSCPEFPDRYKDEGGDPDFHRMSAIINLSSRDSMGLHEAEKST